MNHHLVSQYIYNILANINEMIGDKYTGRYLHNIIIAIIKTKLSTTLRHRLYICLNATLFKVSILCYFNLVLRKSKIFAYN